MINWYPPNIKTVEELSTSAADELSSASFPKTIGSQVLEESKGISRRGTVKGFWGNET